MKAVKKAKLNPTVKIEANVFELLGYCLLMKFQRRKPTAHRTTKTHPNMERGYFMRLGDGGKSGEPWLRVNVGNWYSSFPMYNRNGKTRVNKYVPIKGNLVQVQR